MNEGSIFLVILLFAGYISRHLPPPHVFIISFFTLDSICLWYKIVYFGTLVLVVNMVQNMVLITFEGFVKNNLIFPMVLLDCDLEEDHSNNCGLCMLETLAEAER